MPGVASAARIRPRASSTDDLAARPTPFARFLQAGPSAWARSTPEVGTRVRTLVLASRQVPDGSLHDYLTWRRNLNPTRFDRFHPFLANLLTAPPLTLPTPTTPPSPQVVPEVPPLVPPRGQTVVPEPSTWLIGLGMVGAAMVARRERRRGRDLLE